MLYEVITNPDGSLGDPNDVACSNIEHKLGIHGSPTCSLVFGGNDGCSGWLLGEELEGMKLMFLMMNAARIEVGLQGQAVASASHQAALDYARERLQSRHWSKLRDHEAPQVPIVVITSYSIHYTKLYDELRDEGIGRRAVDLWRRSADETSVPEIGKA